MLPHDVFGVANVRTFQALGQALDDKFFASAGSPNDAERCYVVLVVGQGPLRPPLEYVVLPSEHHAQPLIYFGIESRRQVWIESVARQHEHRMLTGTAQVLQVSAYDVGLVFDLRICRHTELVLYFLCRYFHDVVALAEPTHRNHVLHVSAKYLRNQLLFIQGVC